MNRPEVNQGIIEQIIALKLYDMEASVLNHSIKNFIVLNDHKVHVIACHIGPLSPKTVQLTGASNKYLTIGPKNQKKIRVIYGPPRIARKSYHNGF